MALYPPPPPPPPRVVFNQCSTTGLSNGRGCLDDKHSNMSSFGTLKTLANKQKAPKVDAFNIGFKRFGIAPPYRPISKA